MGAVLIIGETLLHGHGPLVVRNVKEFGVKLPYLSFEQFQWKDRRFFEPRLKFSFVIFCSPSIILVEP